ncbi:hypothetical protein BU17DRAFT_97886 [Hysterangium stoloniferum]|nr:hypothetical protein BU17DRAFT_97886 [Hysterangium stoloniferum]
MSNRSQLPPDTQRSSSSESANDSSIKKLHHVTTRRTSPEDEQRQDREVLEALILEGVQSGAKKFDLPFAITLLSQIAETANPPLLPGLTDRVYSRKCIVENDELFDLLGECLQKGSFSEIRSLEILQPDDSERPHTPIQGRKVVAKGESPRRLTEKETKATTAATIQEFDNYLKYLATGKLDGYLDSIRCEDKLTDLNVDLPLHPILLLHDLGKRPDKDRIKNLFTRGSTVHLFGVSGSGKTRLALEGLCLNWGLYLSCRTTGGPASGSKDVEVATEKILPSLSTWHTGEMGENATAAHRVFAMLLCARVLILKQFVQHVPVNTGATLARRRWVLAQVLPPSLNFQNKDLFVRVLWTLRSADPEIMDSIMTSTLHELTTNRNDLFPEGSRTRLFVVIDEAQVAADNMKEYFRSDTGTDMRPILREMYKYFLNTELFTGFILSGTGLSMKVVGSVSAGSAKNTGASGTRVFTDIGRFTKDDSSQLDYIRRYLTLSDNNSDRRLLERMVYWFSGRHRLTASLIELFIHSENVPRHRVLTSFAEQLTGFKITDAIDLEDDEPPISPELSTSISHYRSISQLDRVFNERNREELMQCLVEVLMRWTLGSEPTTIAIERHMHEIIACGIGFLDKKTSAWEFKADENYPVYISEPLVVLSLSSLFQKQSHTMRETWMANAFRSARTTSSLGYMFDQAILLVLMETFGGKFTPFSDAFHCSESLGSRKVTLVTLKRGADNIMQCSPASWKAGNSDRLGVKASSPKDVLAFLHDPDGKPFLLPDIHMGPDVLCTVQDEETKELIILAVQAKVSPILNAQKWRDAIISVTPEFFYTMQKGEKSDRYARVSYPNLIDDLTGCLEMVLGPAVYTPIADIYRSKLRSSIRAQQQSASHSTRQTPRFLRIIATPDDQQQKRLKREWKGDVAVLQWDVVKGYIGSTADVLKATGPRSSEGNPHKKIKTTR